uniref:Uncharacterized protein LOC104228121 n=1 Tax=Nicotiana sylvestris TaxID=4096 RepID=A0A1U7WJJ8_NICSY|nr:PREDICTED: uncharacterized protein LOC104228121 [Nicotiana sylvestris]
MELQNIQRHIDNDPLNKQLIEHEKEMIMQAKKWEGINEQVLRQKSRAVWIKAELLGSAATELPCIDLDIARNEHCLTKEQQKMLSCKITREDVVKAVKELPNDKAPGIDGFTAEYFKEYWSTIGDEVRKAVLEFFSNGKLLKSVNCTTLTLIPKVASPNSVKEFRPIACCTTIYKIISRIITAKLKLVVDSIVGESQSAFIEGRNILDNVIIAHEMVKGYNKKGVSPRCCIKIDIRKAYDSVEWPFFRMILIEYGMPVKFVELIMYLNRDLKKLKDNPDFNHHPRADEVSIKLMLKSFNHFSEVSGLKANLEKSALYIAGVTKEFKERILDEMQLTLGELPFRYLGVPLSSKKLSVQQCMPLIEKIIARINCWTTKWLSYSGRLQLLKSAIFEMQTYWAQAFLLPKKILKMIVTVCRTFLWTGKNDISRRALIAWDTICMPLSAGGLNILVSYA